MRIGSAESHQLSVDLDESIISGLLQQQHSSSSLLSGSPPQSGRTSPPSTPSSAHLFQQSQQQQQSQFQALQSAHESLELQIDYWPIVKPGTEKDRNQTKAIDQGKNSIKSTFRSLQVRSSWIVCSHKSHKIDFDTFLKKIRFAGFHWIHSQAKFPMGLLSIMLPKRRSKKVRNSLLTTQTAKGNRLFLYLLHSNETGQEKREGSRFGKRTMRWWCRPIDLLSESEAIAPGTVKR